MTVDVGIEMSHSYTHTVTVGVGIVMSHSDTHVVAVDVGIVMSHSDTHAVAVDGGIVMSHSDTHEVTVDVGIVMSHSDTHAVTVDVGIVTITGCPSKHVSNISCQHSVTPFSLIQLLFICLTFSMSTLHQDSSAPPLTQELYAFRT